MHDLKINSTVKVYYYYIIPVRKVLKKWEEKKYPGHLLYGLTEFAKYYISIIIHDIHVNPYKNRCLLSLYNLKKILFCKEQFDVVYAVTHRGLEILIFLRALGLYNKPIILWHHTAIVKSSNFIREKLSCLFYKGIDLCYFFSEELYRRSISTGKVNPNHAKVINWGADLEFYDQYHILSKEKKFVSTGREHRDFLTLLKAVSQTTVPCEILAPKQEIKHDKELDLLLESLPSNVQFKKVQLTVEDIVQTVVDSSAVLICCLNYPYTIGLTTLVEALALGKPIITTDNPTFPFDVEKEKVGLKVPYGDVNAWVKAINYLSTHEEEAINMGKKARILAEERFNLKSFSRVIAQDLLRYKKSS